MIIRPMPYYVFALMLLILFAYMFPVFPLGGGYTVGTKITFTWALIKDILTHAFLPAVSLIVLGVATTLQTMRLIVQGVNEEDYVRYAKIGAVNERTIFARYVMRNAMLPQITGLRSRLCGHLQRRADHGNGLCLSRAWDFWPIGPSSAADYNLLMGITTLSIVAITTSILIMDLLYPLFDPRIRLT